MKPRVFGYTRHDPLEARSVLRGVGEQRLGPNMLALTRSMSAFIRRAGYKEGGVADGDPWFLILSEMRRDDLLVVVSVTHLAADMAGLREILDKIGERGIKLCVLGYSDCSGMSDDECRKRYEGDFRRAGMQRAKAAGTHIGRPRTVDQGAARRLAADGLSVRAIAKQLGVGKSSVQRCLISEAAG